MLPATGNGGGGGRGLKAFPSVPWSWKRFCPSQLGIYKWNCPHSCQLQETESSKTARCLSNCQLFSGASVLFSSSQKTGAGWVIESLWVSSDDFKPIKWVHNVFHLLARSFSQLWWSKQFKKKEAIATTEILYKQTTNVPSNEYNQKQESSSCKLQTIQGVIILLWW